MPEEMMGLMPNSIKVPLLLASIIRNQYIGSDVSEETMPYNGIWLMTKKMRRVSYGGIDGQRLAHLMTMHSRSVPLSTSISD